MQASNHPYLTHGTQQTPLILYFEHLNGSFNILLNKAGVLLAGNVGAPQPGDFFCL